MRIRTKWGCDHAEMFTKIRLVDARLEIRRAWDSPVSGCDVGSRRGFSHAGRFASGYIARFGQSPSAKLEHARRHTQVQTASSTLKMLRGV
jgi:hypothetical protein